MTIEIKIPTTQSTPDHLPLFAYSDKGNIVAYAGRRVSDYRECPIHGFVPTKYASRWSTDLSEVFDIRCECPKCLAERLLAEKLRGSCIPKRFMNRTIETFCVKTDWQATAKRTIESYISDLDRNLGDGRNIVLCGNPGTGKTHLAVSVAIACLNRGKSAAYVTVSDLIARIRDAWGTGKSMEQVQNFVSVDLLILDEVGVQAGTENERNILFDVLNKRYGEMKPTIIISNLNPDGIKRFLGIRVFDRLSENSGLLIPFFGESYRKHAQPGSEVASIARMQIPSAEEVEKFFAVSRAF